MEYIQNHAIMIQLICTVCMLLVTILYVVFTWIQSKYTKQAFVESIRQSKEDRQPYIVPTIGHVSGVAFDTSSDLRIQLSFGEAYFLEVCKNLKPGQDVKAYLPSNMIDVEGLRNTLKEYPIEIIVR